MTYHVNEKAMYSNLLVFKGRALCKYMYYLFGIILKINFSINIKLFNLLLVLAGVMC